MPRFRSIGLALSNYILQPFADDRLRQYRGRRCPVTSDVSGLGSYFLHHLGAHIFNGVLQFDLFCNSHTILGDRRSAKFLFQYYITSFRAQCNLDGIGQDIDTLFSFLLRASISKKSCFAINYFFSRYTIAKMSDSRMIRNSSPSIWISVPAYLPYNTVSPIFKVTGSSFLPGPAATTVPRYCGFRLCRIGNDDPALSSFFFTAGAGFTITLSDKGVTFNFLPIVVSIFLFLMR